MPFVPCPKYHITQALKYFFAMYGSLFKTFIHNFSACNFKVNGNAPNECGISSDGKRLTDVKSPESKRFQENSSLKIQGKAKSQQTPGSKQLSNVAEAMTVWCLGSTLTWWAPQAGACSRFQTQSHTNTHTLLLKLVYRQAFRHASTHLSTYESTA